MRNLTTLDEWCRSLSKANPDITPRDLKILFTVDFLEGTEMLSPCADTTYEPNTEIWVIATDPTDKNTTCAFGQNRLTLAHRLINYGCIKTNHSQEHLLASIQDSIDASYTRDKESEFRDRRHDHFRDEMVKLSDIVRSNPLTNNFDELCNEIVFSKSIGVRFAINRKLKISEQTRKDIIREVDASRKSGRKPGQKSYFYDCERYLQDIVEYGLYDINTENNKEAAARMIKQLFNPPISQGAIKENIRELHNQLLERTTTY